MPDDHADGARRAAGTAPVPSRLLHLPLARQSDRDQWAAAGGTAAVFTEPQGRSGESFAPENLADLIESIAVNGLLQPVLAEEIPGPDGSVSYRLVAGERRLRAMLWGASHLPGNTRFARLAAFVCTGPLSRSQRRRWQVAENLARQDLKPGELGAALLWHRCALLADRLEADGCPVPEHEGDDPAGRYRLLEDLARSRAGVAAPWRDVLADAGLGISPRRARAVTAAFRALPRDLSADMDQHRVAVSARLDLARLAGRADAAAEIWAAVRDRGRPDLAAPAAAARVADPGITAGQAADRALVMAAAAASARQVRRAARPAGQMIDPAVTETLIAGLRSYGVLLRAGGYAEPYAAGSLRLLALEVAGLISALHPCEEAS